MYTATEMKHSRAEIIKSTVCSYLKRRHYTDSEVFLKSDLQLCQTKQQFAILSAVNKEAANKNSIAFSSFVFDFDVLDLHFSRLNSWVSRLSGSVQKEIYAVLPPLLCHLTIDLLSWNVIFECNPSSVSPAITFLKKHASALSVLENSSGDHDNAYGFGKPGAKSEIDEELKHKDWRLMEELYALENCWDICKSKSLLLFRSCKYRLSLTSEALALLQRYLADHGHPCIIQAIKTWFDVDEVSGGPMFKDEEIEDDEDEVIVQLWEEGKEDCFDSEKNSYIKQEQSAVNGCKEESVTSMECKDRESIEESSSECEKSSEKKTSCEDSEEEERQLKLLEGIIRSVREGPSPVKPLLLYSLENADNNVSCTDISLNGDMLSAGLGTSEVKVWGLMEGGLPAEVREVASSNYVNHRDKRQFARLACDLDILDGAAYGYMVEEEEEEWTDTPLILRGHSGTVHDVSFSGRLLYSCSSDTTLRAWNLYENNCVAIYRGHCHPVWCLDVGAWGLYIATGSHDRTARLWSPERAYPLRIYSGHGLDVDCIQFHPNGLYLATGSCDHSVRLWSVSEGKLVRVFPHSLRGRPVSTSEHAANKSSMNYSPSVTALAFSPDGKFLASGAVDQRIRIWDLAAGSVVKELSTHSVILPSEQQPVPAATGDDSFNADGVHAVGVRGAVSALCWSSGGDRIASAYSDGSVAIWELSTGKCGVEYAASPLISHGGNSVHEDSQRATSEGNPELSMAVTTYSTGVSPLSTLRYIERNVLVCVGSSPSRYSVSLK
ncbi:hypothetical protein J437_LFUL010108 [Ladona fulva]|uniref:Transcription initiation factor TFIID subunit 5 n=1 Tax=Ladona fulva TaxID=123851 RepID=A0A8K0P0F6_LADFU|nr:hypothetical protein J437_LFUL010108 [Ladona fulva]